MHCNFAEICQNGPKPDWPKMARCQTWSQH